MASDTRPVPVSGRFPRRPQRGVLLGLSGPAPPRRVSAGVIAVGGLLAGGLWGLVVLAFIWGPLLASAFVRWGGRPAAEWAASSAHYGARLAAGQANYRSRLPLRPRPAGTLALPATQPPPSARRRRLGAAMIHDPHRHTLTAVLPVTHPAFALLDDSDRAGRVGRWGRVLPVSPRREPARRYRCSKPTVPDPALGQRALVANPPLRLGGMGRPPVPDAARPGPARTPPPIGPPSASPSTCAPPSRAIRPPAGGVPGAAEVLREDIVTSSRRIPPPSRPAERAHGSARRNSPSSSATPSTPPATLTLGSPGANLGHAGPVAVSETWDRLRHDSGWSQVLWITEWPRIAVPTDFLHPLVFAPGVRRSLCLVARPLPPRPRCARSAGKRPRPSRTAPEGPDRPARRPLRQPGVRRFAGPGTIHHRRAHRRALQRLRHRHRPDPRGPRRRGRHDHPRRGPGQPANCARLRPSDGSVHHRRPAPRHGAPF